MVNDRVWIRTCETQHIERVCAIEYVWHSKPDVNMTKWVRIKNNKYT